MYETVSHENSLYTVIYFGIIIHSDHAIAVSINKVFCITQFSSYILEILSQAIDVRNFSGLVFGKSEGDYGAVSFPGSLYGENVGENGKGIQSDCKWSNV
jgi:hypothetical protein